MRIQKPIFIILALFLISCSNIKKEQIDYVDPFIGTGGHGHTFPGASVPFGMVQLSPDTRLEGWDGCSAYHYSDNIVYGFSHTHLSGTGCSDYGDILLMPFTGKIVFDNGYKNGVDNGYASRFKKKNEKASPGYYSTLLDDYNIKVELTASNRAGFHKYTFNDPENAHIIIDLKHRDEVISSSLKKVSGTEICGKRISHAWANNQFIYFVARFSQPFTKIIIDKNDTILNDITETSGKNIKAVLNFDIKKNKPLLVKVGISAVSIEGARKNLDAEIPGWNFDTIKSSSEKLWTDELKKISVQGTEKEKTIFYTALYHSLLAPNTFMDIDRQYRGTDLKIHKAEDFTNYTVFSLWDTYRATHPLFTIIEQKRTGDFIKTFIHQYENGGQLPVWELAGNYTGCMIGYHSIPVICDAYVKGIRNFDVEEAYEAMKHSAMQDHLGLKAYKKYGYIPADKESESVSKTLEYAYDDWCIAVMAKALKKDNDYKYFIKRAQSYKNIFDPQTKFMRPKSYGLFKYPFDPAEVDFNFTEANSWQYSFYVPQDIMGLIRLMGGKKAFANKLDSLFNAKPETTGRNQADITGLIGQYAHGNEPSHHMAYLYNYANEPWKTQQKVNQICKTLYDDKPDGLSGNEDCGQMSSWYVLSSLGFYPVTPGSNVYAIGSPIFKNAVINLENNNTFIIKAKNVSDKNIYIQSATLNGKPYNKSYILYQDIIKGGEIDFVMGRTPNKYWGSFDEDIPVSEISDNKILPVPYSKLKRRAFVDSSLVELCTNVKNAEIYFTTDGSDPDTLSEIYKKPFYIYETSTIKCFAKKGEKLSKITSIEQIKFKGGRSIKLETHYSSQYTGGGDSALIDNIRGGNDFRLGVWQGYHGEDLIAVVGLKKISNIKQVSVGFLQDINSWIFMPLYLEVQTSTDGKNFKFAGKTYSDVPQNKRGSITKDFTVKFKNRKAKFVRVIGKSLIMCPDWHKGRGNKCHIFADEILIK